MAEPPSGLGIRLVCRHYKSLSFAAYWVQASGGKKLIALAAALDFSAPHGKPSAASALSVTNMGHGPITGHTANAIEPICSSIRAGAEEE